MLSVTSERVSDVRAAGVSAATRSPIVTPGCRNARCSLSRSPGSFGQSVNTAAQTWSAPNCVSPSGVSPSGVSPSGVSPSGRFPEGRFAERRLAQGGPAQVGLAERCFPEGGFAERGFPEWGFAEGGFAERGFPEWGFPEWGFAERGFAEWGFAEWGFAERRAADAEREDSRGRAVRRCRGAPALQVRIERVVRERALELRERDTVAEREGDRGHVAQGAAREVQVGEGDVVRSLTVEHREPWRDARTRHPG